ncbi:cytochrome domain of cellobiose dehydrogenase domain-containing protein [Sarocladium implicatum]|nr:cytochrome domain of cellobiose dehydrogenase domain-containing protein [Sarocladium implicatum]
MSVLSKPLGCTSWAYALKLIALLATAQQVAAQTTESFTDPLTGIVFQRFFGAATSFGFGIALPENPSTDFIGQLDVPMPNGEGWAGISLQEDMVDPLLIVAWPNGNKVVSSFRVARNEDDSPPEVTGDFSIVEIPEGTKVTASQMTFTFLCRNCLDDGQKSFSPQNTRGKFAMGWALADRPVSNAADTAAELPFHNVGFDDFDAILSQARSPLFGEWAQLAGAGIVSNGSTTAVPKDPPGQETGGDVDSGDESGGDAGDSGDEDGFDSDGDSDDDD